VTRAADAVAVAVAAAVLARAVWHWMERDALKRAASGYLP